MIAICGRRWQVITVGNSFNLTDIDNKACSACGVGGYVYTRDLIGHLGKRGNLI